MGSCFRPKNGGERGFGVGLGLMEGLGSMGFGGLKGEVQFGELPHSGQGSRRFQEVLEGQRGNWHLSLGVSSVWRDLSRPRPAPRDRAVPFFPGRGLSTGWLSPPGLADLRLPSRALEFQWESPSIRVTSWAPGPSEAAPSPSPPSAGP